MANYIFTTDDQTEYLQAIHGLSALLSLWDIDQWFRTQMKYGQLPTEVYKKLDEGRDELSGLLSRRGIDLDQLIE